MEAPNVVIVAGPNGAGKSTAAKTSVRDRLGVLHYVNADTIARGLSEFDSENMAFKAGRIMLEHVKELAKEKAHFAFETTLASRTFAPWISELKREGYLFNLIFLWLPSEEMAINRVRDRVLRGGHHIPDETVRRRYQRGLENFFRMYAPLADKFQFFDNSNPNEPRLIAEKLNIMVRVEDQTLWDSIQAKVRR